ncbi:MAG: hypothetical protein SNJ80_09545 [Anaerolinea sp.]
MGFKVKKRGPLAARARRGAYFSMGIASLWCLLSVVDLFRFPSVAGMHLSTFYLHSLLILAVNIVVLIGSWRGRHAPQQAARVALFGGVGMLVAPLVIFGGMPGLAWLLLPGIYSVYALPYLITAGLQWRVYRLMRQSEVTPHEAAYADASRLALTKDKEDSSNASDDTQKPPQQRNLV